MAKQSLPRLPFPVPVVVNPVPAFNPMGVERVAMLPPPRPYANNRNAKSNSRGKQRSRGRR